MADTAAFLNPLQTFTSGYNIGAGIQGQQQAADAAAAAAQRQAELMAIVQRLQQPDATYDDYMKASILLPKDQAEAVQNAAKNMNVEEQQAALQDTTKIFSAFRSGHPEIGLGLLEQQAQAERAAGNDQGANFAYTLIKQAKDDPTFNKAIENMLGYQLTALPGGKDAFDAITKMEVDKRLTEEHPGLMAEKAKLLEKATTDEEKNKIELEFKARMEAADLAYKQAQTWALMHPRETGSGIDQTANKLINDASDEVGTANQAAVRALNLADAIDKAAPPGGWPQGVIGKGWEAIKGVTGGQDVVSALHQEYRTLRTSEALKHLPPGSASDADVNLALSVYPDENSNPGYIASFMRGVAKLQAYNAEYNKAKVDWVDNVGSLASAKEPFVANGVQVKPDMKFWNVTDKLVIPNVAGPNKAGPAPITPTAPLPLTLSYGGQTLKFDTQEHLDAFKKAKGVQ